MVAHLCGGGEIPLLLAVERRCGDASWNVDALGHLRDLLEGALNTVVNVVEQSGSEFDGEGLAGSHYGVANLDAGCEGIALAGGKIRGLPL